MINGRVDPQSLRSKPPSSSPCLRNPSDGVYPLYPPQPLGPTLVGAFHCLSVRFPSFALCAAIDSPRVSLSDAY